MNESDGSQVLVDGTFYGIAFDAKAAARKRQCRRLGRRSSARYGCTRRIFRCRPSLRNRPLPKAFTDRTPDRGASTTRSMIASTFPGADHRTDRPGGQDKRFAPGLLSVVRGLVSSEVEVRPGGG